MSEEIIRFMGEVSNELKNFNKNLEELKATNQVLHKDIDEVKKNQTIAEVNIKALHRRVDDISIKTEKHEDLKNKAIGIIGFLSAVFGSVGAAISIIVQNAIK